MKSAIATAVLLLITAAVALLAMRHVGGPRAKAPVTIPVAGRVYYVVPYLYGYAFYNDRFEEVPIIRVKAGKPVTLVIVPALVLSQDAFLDYARRTVHRGIAELPPGDPQILNKIQEDLALGNVEHIVGISEHPVFVETKVAAMLQSNQPRTQGPNTVREAVERRLPGIVTVTLTPRKVGRFDVLCVDADPLAGTGTCGWGHKWMITRGGFVVEP